MCNKRGEEGGPSATDIVWVSSIMQCYFDKTAALVENNTMRKPFKHNNAYIYLFANLSYLDFHQKKSCHRVGVPNIRECAEMRLY